MLFAIDRKGRLAREIAAQVGWRPRAIGRLLVIGESRTVRRRVAEHASTFESALPHRIVEVRRFLANPRDREPLRGLMFLSASPQATPRHRQRGPREPS
jgi:hypothetical protein